MDNKSILQKIKSKYILEIIGSFISIENYIFKLIIYSKGIQEKFEIGLINYQEIFFSKRIKWENYISTLSTYSFNKDKLIKKLKDDFSEYKADFNNINKIIITYCFNKYKKIISACNINKELDIFDICQYIDIYSPFFYLLLKDEILSQIFTIKIISSQIEQYNLLNEYKTLFNNLNNSNSRYSSLELNFQKTDDILYFSKFDINFNHIKKISVIQEGEYSTNDYNYLFNILLSNVNIINNLVYLHLLIYSKKINTSSFENINNFKSLKYLELNGCLFQTLFTLKLDKLKKLNLSFCSNIKFSKNIFLNLKSLKLVNNEMDVDLIDSPELEEISIIDKQDKYKLLLDFSNLNKLKTFKGNIQTFLLLDSPLLEKIIILSNKHNDCIIERQCIEKIFTLKYLKHIDIELKEIYDFEIFLIKGENTSVSEMNIIWKNIYNDLVLYNLEKKLPNLSNLSITVNIDNENCSNLSLDIRENCDCKVNKLSINIQEIGCENIEVYCHSFETLESISLESKYNIHINFPIFNDNNQKIFKSLKILKFVVSDDDIKIERLKNLYDNINKMLNLREIIIQCHLKGIDENFYMNFIKKILYLKSINKIELLIIGDDWDINESYTIKELKKLFPDVNYNKIYQLFIPKIQVNK